MTGKKHSAFLEEQTIIKLIRTMEENFEWEVNRKKMKKLRQFGEKKRCVDI